jgi:hypothetical protein
MKFPREEFVLLKSMHPQLVEIAGKVQCYLMGGAVSCLFTGRKINDYDFYFRSEDDLDKFIALLKEKEQEFTAYQTLSPAKRKNTAKPVYVKLRHESDNSYSFAIGDQKVQCIRYRKFIGNPEEIWRYFDFTVCMAAYSFAEREFHLHEQFLLHNAQKKIVFQHTTEYPIVSLIRVNKYIRYGYWINAIELIKLALTINSLKLHDYKAIKKQLMGIDTLFLKPLTDWLGSHPEEAFDLNAFMEQYQQVILQAYSIPDSAIIDDNQETVSPIIEEIIQ